MLFDLRGRGRRRTVRVIYTGLALLMGVGLIGFGIGGGLGGGGILNAASNGEGSGSASQAGQIKKYKKLIAKQPNDVSAWESLISAQLHEGAGEAYEKESKLTSKGKELFSQIAQSWNSYLALNPPKPNAELAQEMERIFGEEGLNQPAEEVKVLQVVIAVKPEITPQYESSLYASMAEYAYKAHNTRIGDLASEKAISLAPATQRKQLKSELAELKKSSAGTSSSAASGAASTGAASTGSSVSTSGAASGSSGTVTIGGKTYPIHVGASGATGTSTAAKKK
jgi:hypothetical protein